MTVTSAISAADAGYAEGLRGMYPAAAKTLADEYRALLAAAKGALASWDDESDTTIHEAMAALRRAIVRAAAAAPSIPAAGTSAGICMDASTGEAPASA